MLITHRKKKILKFVEPTRSIFRGTHRDRSFTTEEPTPGSCWQPSTCALGLRYLLAFLLSGSCDNPWPCLLCKLPSVKILYESPKCALIPRGFDKIKQNQFSQPRTHQSQRSRVDPLPPVPTPTASCAHSTPWLATVLQSYVPVRVVCSTGITESTALSSPYSTS